MHSPKSVPKHNKSFTFEAIGTQWQIDIASNKQIATELENSIYELINDFDKTYSRFKKDSWLWQLNVKAGTYTLPKNAKLLFDFYADMYKQTGGLVTPLIGQALSDAGYDADYSLQPKVVSQPPDWDDVMKIDKSHIVIKKPILLDFGAAGKGYLVDLVSKLIEQEPELQSYCVDAGGDMFYRNYTGDAISVGLEHPDTANQVLGVVTLSNRAICGSAGNKRTWAQYHHILNPFSLQSPTKIKAVWAIADTTMLADGMTTCLFFVEPSALTKYDFEYLIIYEDNQYGMSPDFPAELFTTSTPL